LFAGLLLVTACTPAPTTSTAAPGAARWYAFEGTWTAAGNQEILNLGSDRQASIANFSGSLLLTGPARPGVGFRANAIVLDDSMSGLVGRAVWTDERGDQVFSELHRAGRARSNTVSGTFVGGTGRYSGANGTYQFSWRFLIQTGDGTVQGQSEGLKGRVHVGS
jgi:hypothetical protein